MGYGPDRVAASPEPIRVIRPVVVPAQFLVLGPIAAAFLAIFPGFFTFIVSNMITWNFQPVAGPGLVAYGISFATILGLIGLRVFAGPGRTTYSIHADRIESEEGFFTRQRRTIPLAQVVDVHLSEGILQRTAGAGSVTLMMNSLVGMGDGRFMNRTFRLANVSDPVGVYDLIRSLALGGHEVGGNNPD